MSDIIVEPLSSVDLSGASFEDLVAEMIRRLGEDPEREGMLKTPSRVAKSARSASRFPISKTCNVFSRKSRSTR